MEGEQSQRARLRHVRHPWRLTGFVVVSLLITGVAFYAGTLVRSPESAVVSAAQVKIPVYAPVESRSVSTAQSFQGSVVAGSTESIGLGSLPGSEASAVVTSSDVKAGDRIKSGALLGAIADRPLFFLQTAIPLYRDLRAGDKGSDVVALREALGLPEAVEKVGPVLLNRVADLYRDAGFSPPRAGQELFIASDEFYSSIASSYEPIVTDIAPRGTVLTSEREFATLQTSANQVQFRVNVASEDLVPLGTDLVLRSAGGNTKGTVIATGDFAPAETAEGVEATQPGFDVTLELDKLTDESAFAPGDPVTVTVGNTEPTPGLAAPLSAVRQDVRGAYVLVVRDPADDGDETGSVATADERVNVTITAQSQGWAALDGELQVGDRLKVFP